MLATKLLLPDDTGLAHACDLLAAGALVAFPTETVYGLGADARDDMAVARIFDAKGRPHFNPLIVHVASTERAQHFVQWSPMADRLARAFWPGPLTLVLPLKQGHGLSPLVTAGLDTLALRVPAHPLAAELLNRYGGPLAAPSANPSGRISPTTADHVRDGLHGRIEAILDGGPCTVGVESTILGLADNTPTLLRPGGIAAEDIEQVLNTPLRLHSDTDTLTAPGQMASHYAPDARVRLNATQADKNELLLGFGHMECDQNLSESGNLTEAAANLFRALHDLDNQSKPIAVAPIPDIGLGRAINDRLRRAAAPRP